MTNLAKVNLFLIFSVLVVCDVESIVGYWRRGNPCRYKHCHPYAQCKAVSPFSAVCICPRACPRLLQPVCGTDWRTYNNLCQLRALTCAQRKATRLRYYGECEAGICWRPIWHYFSRCPYYSKCALFYGFRHCVCPKRNCSSVPSRPICGTDGMTYRNSCVMMSTACKLRKWIRIRHRGPCRKDPCRTKKCCCGGKCVVKATNETTCACNFGCTRQHNRVCGSDGKTYRNICVLRLTACIQQNPSLVQLDSGPCLSTTPSPTPTITPCAAIRCAHFATCEVRNGSVQCICPPICFNFNSPVCGTDNVTYPNMCELERTSCLEQRTIRVAKRGRCGPSFVCPPQRVCLIFCDKKECAKKGQICCCRGCGNVCTTPIKSGGRDVCPPEESSCLLDSECSGGMKCCLDGCSKKCVPPKIVH